MTVVRFVEGFADDRTADVQRALDLVSGRGGRVVLSGHLNLSGVNVDRAGTEIVIRPGSLIFNTGEGALFRVRADRFTYNGGKARIHGNYAGEAFRFEGANYGAVRDAWITGQATCIHLTAVSMNNAFAFIKGGPVSGPAIVVEGTSNDNQFFASEYGNGGGCTQNLVVEGSTANDFRCSFGGGLIGDDKTRIIFKAGAGANYFSGRLEQDPGITLIRAEEGSHENVVYHCPGLTQANASQWVEDAGLANQLPA